MVCNNLSRIMGERLEKITTVSKETGISRTTLTNLYYKRAKNISFKTIDTLCEYFECGIGDLFEKKNE